MAKWMLPDPAWEGPEIPLSHLMKRIGDVKVVRILLLGSAGQHLPSSDQDTWEEHVGEAGEENYLKQTGANLVMMRDTLITDYGVPAPHVCLEDFTTVHRRTPRGVLNKFLQADFPTKLIYFTGHGNANGFWSFSWYPEGKEQIVHSLIEPKDFVEAKGQVCLVVQACHSGWWMKYNQHFVTWGTSAGPGNLSKGNDTGSEWTKWLLGKEDYPKKSNPRHIPANVSLDQLLPGQFVQFRAYNEYQVMGLQSSLGTIGAVNAQNGTVWLTSAKTRKSVIIPFLWIESIISENVPKVHVGYYVKAHWYGKPEHTISRGLKFGTITDVVSWSMIKIMYDDGDVEEIIPKSFVKCIRCRLIDQLQEHMRVESHWREGYGRSDEADFGVVRKINDDAWVELQFQDGVKQTVPAGFIINICDDVAVTVGNYVKTHRWCWDNEHYTDQLLFGTVIKLLPGGEILYRSDFSTEVQKVPGSFVERVCSRLINKLKEGMEVESHWKEEGEGGAKSECTDIGIVTRVKGGFIQITFQDGVKQTIPAGFIKHRVR